MAVQRQDNGDLTWVQDGKIITVSKEDPMMYNPALQTESLQISAQQQNNAQMNAYLDKLHIAQTNVDASRPIPGVPVPPLYVTVTDPVKSGTTVTPGVQSTAPWPPPGLPELKHKTIYPSGKPAQEEEFIIEPAHPEQH